MSDGDRDSDDLDWDEVARLPDESDGCFANVRSQEIAKPKRNYDLPHLSKRTKEQHVFTAHKIPRRKAMMNSRRLKQQSKEQANNVTALIRDSFFCWTVRDGFQPQLPSIRLARKIKTRTADVAKTFDCDPSMVTQARAVVAHASCTSDNNLVDAIGKEFERNPT